MYRENVKRTWTQPICTPSLKQNGGEGGREFLLCLRVCVCMRACPQPPLYFESVLEQGGAIGSL